MVTDDGVARLRSLTHVLAKGALAPAQRLAMVQSVVGQMAVGASNGGIVPSSVHDGCTSGDAACHMSAVHSAERQHGQRHDSQTDDNVYHAQRLNRRYCEDSTLCPDTASIPAVHSTSQLEQQQHQRSQYGTNVQEYNDVYMRQDLLQQHPQRLEMQGSGLLAEEAGAFMHPYGLSNHSMSQLNPQQSAQGLAQGDFCNLLHQQLYREYMQRPHHSVAQQEIGKQGSCTNPVQRAPYGQSWHAGSLHTGRSSLHVDALASNAGGLSAADPTAPSSAVGSLGCADPPEWGYMQPAAEPAPSNTYRSRLHQSVPQSHDDGVLAQMQNQTQQLQPVRRTFSGPDSDECLPGWHCDDHSMRLQEMTTADSAAVGLARHDSAYELEAASEYPPTRSGSPAAMAELLQEEKPGKGRPRIRRNKVSELQTKVDALKQQLSELCDLNGDLRKKEQQLHGHLTEREREVTRLRMMKHKALTGSQGWQEGDKQAHANGLSSCNQPTDMSAYRLSAPCLGYDSQVWREQILPTVNGGIVSPGVLPVFALLPESAVQTAAKNLTRFVTEAGELRALYSGSELEQEVEEYLIVRTAVLQGVMRRYNVLNPVFMYQLRAINLSTGEPCSPPPCHWSNMAKLMRELITSEELQELRLTYRSFKASLRAITKEQQTITSQLMNMIQGLQSMPVIAADGQQQQPELESSDANDAEHVSGVTPASGCSAPSATTSSSPSPAAPPLAEDIACSVPPHVAGVDPTSVLNSTAANSQLPDETILLEQMQVQQKVIELLEQLEQLLLREHDQHFVLLWSCTRMPSSMKVVMELVLASYPFLVNFHEVLPHLLDEQC